MTDPTILTQEQLVQYVRQLQQTVRFWQIETAKAHGMTRDEMIQGMLADFKKEPPHIADALAPNYVAEWDADAAEPHLR